MTAPVRRSAAETASLMSGSMAREHAGDLGAVGVEGESEKQLGADGDEFDVHGVTTECALRVYFVPGY